MRCSDQKITLSVNERLGGPNGRQFIGIASMPKYAVPETRSPWLLTCATRRQEVGSSNKSFLKRQREIINGMETTALIITEEGMMPHIPVARTTETLTAALIGMIQAFNECAQKFFGYDLSEILGQNVSILVPEPDRSKHDAYLCKYKETRESKVGHGV